MDIANANACGIPIDSGLRLSIHMRAVRLQRGYLAMLTRRFWKWSTDARFNDFKRLAANLNECNEFPHCEEMARAHPLMEVSAGFVTEKH
ncbi:hypothetical protein AXG89_07710 [Burkholderia sp. PAMC 26561]|nr:hypothetical protein AXG89_07710 [Burkholderia sp. PAMC 26561]